MISTRLRCAVLAHFSIRHACCVAHSALVLEAAVLVLAEEREADGGQGVGLEKLETLFEGVVDLDLAGTVENDDAAGSVEYMLARYVLWKPFPS